VVIEALKVVNWSEKPKVLNVSLLFLYMAVLPLLRHAKKLLNVLKYIKIFVFITVFEFGSGVFCSELSEAKLQLVFL
jgi:hypothetical protein